MVLSFFLLISLLSVSCNALTWDDRTWLNGREIMTDLAEKAVRDLKRQSDIHLYDDIELVNVLQQRKSISGDKRSIYMKILVKSLHFAEHTAEEPFDVLILHELPSMDPKFVDRMTKKWSAEEETEL